eukprot:2274378-Pyramimonas_sp.AAC.1
MLWADQSKMRCDTWIAPVPMDTWALRGASRTWSDVAQSAAEASQGARAVSSNVAEANSWRH